MSYNTQSSCYKYFVGIDLSYSCTGIVTSQDIHIGVKAGKPSDSFYSRVSGLWRTLLSTLPMPAEDTLVAIEGAAFGKPFQAFHLGELAGVIKYLLAVNRYTVILVPPTTLKKFATGKGNATKEEMNLINRWEYHNSNDNIVDAFCLMKYAESYLPEDKVEVKKKARLRRPQKTAPVSDVLI